MDRSWFRLNRTDRHPAEQQKTNNTGKWIFLVEVHLQVNIREYMSLKILVCLHTDSNIKIMQVYIFLWIDLQFHVIFI